MLKLILEDIARSNIYMSLTLDLSKPVRIARASGRGHICTVSTDFQDVFLNDPRLGELWVLIDSRVPNMQGHFKLEEEKVVYNNCCVHGTLIRPADGGRQFVLSGQYPYLGTYYAGVGDRFIIGFPRGRHLYQITLVNEDDKSTI